MLLTLVLPVPAEISTSRLLLRRFQPDDLAPFTQFMTTPEATQHLSFHEAAKTPEGARHLLDMAVASYQRDNPIFVLAAESRATGQYLGACGLNPVEPGVAELFYTIMPTYWGQGLATEMAQALVDYAFTQLPLHTLKAIVVPGHHPAIRVAEKVGFRDTGLVRNPAFRAPVHLYVCTQVGGDGAR